MSLDPDHLMSYEIPSVTQSYSEKDSALYALSLGVGQDPLDKSELQFAGGAGPVVAFPSMPVVLGHPGFWLGRPDTGVDPVQVVHGEQSIDIYKPIASSGTVTGTTRVTGLVDKGPDKGALLYTEKELVDEDGEIFAKTHRTTFIRGAGGFGKSTVEEKSVPKPPETEPDIVVESATRPEQALYYRWNGDDNPLHVDPDVAKKAGFHRPILHGLCTYGIAARLIVHSMLKDNPSSLRHLSGRFTSPVFPGNRLRAFIWKSGYFRILNDSNGRIVMDNGTFSST